MSSEGESKADLAIVNDDTPRAYRKERRVEFTDSVKGFCEEAEIPLNDKIYEWLRSDMVKPRWIKVWESNFKDLAKGRPRPSLQEVLNEIALGEKNGKGKYSAQKEQGKNGSFLENLASFHFNVKSVNTKSPAICGPGKINKVKNGGEIFDIMIPKVPKKRVNPGSESNVSKKQKTATDPEIERKVEAAEEPKITNAAGPGEGQADEDKKLPESNKDISGPADVLQATNWAEELRTPQKREALQQISDAFDLGVPFRNLVLLVKVLIKDVIRPTAFIPEVLQPPIEKKVETAVNDSGQQVDFEHDGTGKTGKEVVDDDAQEQG
ncbi:hypothetical protein PHISCL_05808 [Aspergillus sclerotialis]|uniref:Uncharacterized protein n=1 Tax=Aspergillus sclerotialis TaxID=2070753 RepID=A0A3A2ZKD6_9EURO|nr:hypothetical protein PHISCL_05808 [Aspergillus sclerotialis]